MSRPADSQVVTAPLSHGPVRAGSQRWLFGTALAAATVIGGAGLVTVLSGRIEGVEFSPQSFERRTFAYYEIPWLHWQLTRVSRTIRLDPCERGLIADKVLVVTSVERWDLVTGTRGGEVLDPRGASILCAYLDSVDRAGQPEWLKWSREHPRLAPSLWSVVAMLARRGWYEFLPDVFHAARTSQTLPKDRFVENMKRAVISQAQLLREQLGPTSPDTARNLQALLDELSEPRGASTSEG